MSFLPLLPSGRFNGAVDLNPRKPGLVSIRRGASVRCFNGAVDLNPRKLVSVSILSGDTWKLQWGRGFESTETTRQADQAVRPFRASMGPWI